MTRIFRMKVHLNFMCVDKCSLNPIEVIKIGPIRKPESEAKSRGKKAESVLAPAHFKSVRSSFEAGYTSIWRCRWGLFRIT